MTLGIIIPDISNPYYAEIVRGIQDAADTAGYAVLIQNTDRKIERIINHIYLLREKHADGIIFTGGIFNGRDLTETLSNLSTRAVAIGRIEGDFPSVRVDNAGAAHIAVEHLAGLGHKEIAFINGAVESTTMIDRLQGFRDALDRFRCPRRDKFILSGSLTLSGGYEGTKTLIGYGRRPTAIITANDQMAFGAVKAVKEAGLRIPRDIALIGFDNVPLCSYFEPSITSVEIPKYKLGAAAMETLVDLIQGREIEQTRWFKVSLIKRESTIPRPEKK
jgi:DNA-binding LacI/PurR family transcriptional regulator